MCFVIVMLGGSTVYVCNGCVIVALAKGYWSMKEDNLLTEVVKEFVGDHYLDLDKSVSSWSEIAERMPGRDKDQCYAHW